MIEYFLESEDCIVTGGWKWEQLSTYLTPDMSSSVDLGQTKSVLHLATMTEDPNYLLKIWTVFIEQKDKLEIRERSLIEHAYYTAVRDEDTSALNILEQATQLIYPNDNQKDTHHAFMLGAQEKIKTSKKKWWQFWR